MLFFLVVMAAVFSCSGPTPLSGAKPIDTPELLSRLEQSENPEKDPDYSRAKEFHEFLEGTLTADQTGQLVGRCRQAPTENIFCFSVLNRDYFEEKVEAQKEQRQRERRKLKRISPVFKKGKIQNWTDLRHASVSATLRGVASLKKANLEALKKKALEEEDCPLNVAISIAATLEDLLPGEADPVEIGRLYEKGGRCIVKNASDRVTMLTRGALFYLIKGEHQLAKRALVKATEYSNTFLARAYYWLYRTHLALGESKKAAAILEALQQRYPFSFHTLVALTAKDRDPGELLEKRAEAQLKRSQQMPLINPLIEQVEILHRLKFDESAKKVLDWAVVESHGIEPEVKIYLAGLKKRQGDYFTKISILSDVLYNNPALVSKDTLELYFPKVFFPLFEKQSELIDPYLLLSIARRESAFNVKAVSSADARGLLQILPKVKNQLKKENNLFNAEDNVEVGAFYLLKLLDKLDGQIHLALAAYNAGPARLRSWTERYAVNDPILFIDLIPYRETREYVASILRNYYWYRRIHEGGQALPPQRFLELAITKGG